METILFGGNDCKNTIYDYLRSNLRAIAVQIEVGLKANKNEEQIKEEMLKMFRVQKFNFNLSGAEVKNYGANRFGNRIIDGVSKKVLENCFTYEISFEGDSRMLAYRPKFFHGHNCKAEISPTQKGGIIKVNFYSEQNSQKEFDFGKSQSIGSLVDNGNEANNEIEIWNNNLKNEIIKIYPLVKVKYEETIEFNKRNNIK